MPFIKKSQNLNNINGQRLIRIGRVSSWQRGSFIASIGNTSGTESDILSISFCLESSTPRISYKRVGSSSMQLKILYKMEGNILQVYLWSPVTSDSTLCLSGFSTHSIEDEGSVTDITTYNEVASL